MNYTLKYVPEREIKPREKGITMVMDKGLSVNETENFLSVSSNHTDLVKLGWATSFVTPNLQDKLNVYRQAGIPVYLKLATLFRILP